MYLEMFLLLFCIFAAGIVQAQYGRRIPGRKLDCVFVEQKQNEGTDMFGPTTLKRKANLLFGDIITNEEAIIFKVQESSLDIFQYADKKLDTVGCEISRYSTHGIHVPWPHQVAYIVHTRTPLIRAKLKQDLVLDCGYTIDHSTDFNIDWRYQHKGNKKKLFAYNGRHQRVEYIEKGVELFMDQIKQGNASLLLRNIGVKDEGSYLCSVYVPPLFGTHTIEVEIMESPIVSVYPNSVSLIEGDEQKLVCDAGRYYPLDVEVKWLRQKGERHMLPVYMTNVVFSPHKRNMDGTYNVTSFFRFTASLSDNGVTYTCRVEHVSIDKPIKRYIQVSVEAQSRTLQFLLLSIVIILICAVVITLLIYLKKVAEKNKKKPY
ncbi:tapasin-related protein-like isoform X2 [Hemiscyllium ocellatum]|uniref:tapasin-related protein-like isoform X2 n=1 Tax=Hemiscyllium ocellatum TaxID=170820 RepID=UPI002965D69E|nr:tapasin-related protein-like isoform X2 [Hemiscyllium ocellatum]